MSQRRARRQTPRRARGGAAAVWAHTACTRRRRARAGRRAAAARGAGRARAAPAASTCAPAPRQRCQPHDSAHATPPQAAGSSTRRAPGVLLSSQAAWSGQQHGCRAPSKRTGVLSACAWRLRVQAHAVKSLIRQYQLTLSTSPQPKAIHSPPTCLQQVKLMEVPQCSARRAAGAPAGGRRSAPVRLQAVQQRHAAERERRLRGGLRGSAALHRRARRQQPRRQQVRR